MAALFRHVGRREITVMRLAGSARPEAINAERTRSRNSATALSPRPTMVKATVPDGDLHLDVDRSRLHALKGYRRYARNHVRPPPGLADAEHLQNNRPSARG